MPKIGGAVVLSEHYFLLLEAVGNIQVQYTSERLVYVLSRSQLNARFLHFLEMHLTEVDLFPLF